MTDMPLYVNTIKPANATIMDRIPIVVDMFFLLVISL